MVRTGATIFSPLISDICFKEKATNNAPRAGQLFEMAKGGFASERQASVVLGDKGPVPVIDQVGRIRLEGHDRALPRTSHPHCDQMGASSCSVIRAAKPAYPKLIHYNRLPKGGHFAAWEQPELFAAEMRAAFKSLR